MTIQHQDETDQQLRSSLTSAYPSAAPSEALQKRIRALIDAPSVPPVVPTRVVQKPFRWAVALAGITVLTLGVVLSRPKLVAAEILQRMETEVGDVRNAHVTLWGLTPNGSRVKRSEIWFQGGQWRSERTDAPDLQFFQNGKLWSYDTHEKEATVERQKNPLSHPLSVFRFDAMVKKQMEGSQKPTVRIESTVEVDGQPADWISVQQYDGRTQARYLVDRVTNLPYRSEVSFKSDETTTLRIEVEYRFNQVFPTTLLQPKFPQGVSVVDLDRERPLVQTQLNRTLQRKTVGGRQVVLRDVQRNEKGDLFFLFTYGVLANESPWYGEVALTDARNQPIRVTYRHFPSHAPSPTPEQLKSIVVNGEVLNGVACLGAGAQLANTSGPLTLSLRVPVKRTRKPGSNGFSIIQTWVKFQVKLPPPTCAIRPKYTHLMSFAPTAQSIWDFHTQQDASTESKALSAR